MRGLSIPGQFAGRLRIVNCVHQTKQFELSWQDERVDPPLICIDQICRPRKNNNLSVNWRRDEDKKLSLMAVAHLIAHRQGTNHISYPAESAEKNRSFSATGALEKQPDGERYPAADPPSETEKSTPPWSQ